MKNLFRIFGLMSALVCGAALLPAQSYILTPTTLSTAIADSRVQTITVASASPNGQTVNNLLAGNSVYVDRELMTIKSVSGTTAIVIRGQGGTFAAPHVSGAYTFIAQPILFTAQYKQGACTRGTELVVPVIDVKDGIIFECLKGQWDQGDILAGTQVSPRFRVETSPSGGTVYTSLNTTGTTLAATTMYCAELNIPTNKLLTGLAWLNGTTVGTDKHLMALFDSGGNLLANSAVAGATTSGASTYQQAAFTTAYFAIGPAQYFACLQTNGTTDTVRMVVTGTQDNLLTKGVTSQTFGTLAAFTAPTTFTTAVGPYAYAY